MVGELGFEFYILSLKNLKFNMFSPTKGLSLVTKHTLEWGQPKALSLPFLSDNSLFISLFYLNF